MFFHFVVLARTPHGSVLGPWSSATRKARTKKRQRRTGQRTTLRMTPSLREMRAAAQGEREKGRATASSVARPRAKFASDADGKDNAIQLDEKAVADGDDKKRVGEDSVT